MNVIYVYNRLHIPYFKLYFTYMTYLTLFNYNNENITVREEDGYFNATPMCKAMGKQFSDFTRNQWTIEYLQALERSTGIPRDHLTQVKMDGLNHERGSWIHPLIAIRLAQWLSPDFAVLVDLCLQQHMERGDKYKQQEQLKLGNIPLKPRDEFDLSNRIQSWAALCGYNYVIECPLINTVNTKTKTRRLDLVKFNGRNIVAIELKLNKVTGKDVYNTVIDREYINLLRAYSNRPVKLIMMSPYEADDEAHLFIKQTKEDISFKTVSAFCEELFYKGLLKKWQPQPYYLRNMLFYNEFEKLFNYNFIEQQRQLAKIRDITLAA